METAADLQRLIAFHRIFAMEAIKAPLDSSVGRAEFTQRALGHIAIVRFLEEELNKI